MLYHIVVGFSHTSTRISYEWGSGWQATFVPGDLSDLGIEPGSLSLQADSLLSELPGKPEVFN